MIFLGMEASDRVEGFNLSGLSNVQLSAPSRGNPRWPNLRAVLMNDVKDTSV